MARTLEEIDPTKPIHLTNARHNLDQPMLELVEHSDRIRLTSEEGALFLSWVGQTRWRTLIEADLQCHSKDGRTGEPLLTAEIPLVTFREHLCAGGRHMQDARTAALFDRLRVLTRSWRDSGGDTVRVDGYAQTIATHGPAGAHSGLRDDEERAAEQRAAVDLAEFKQAAFPDAAALAAALANPAFEEPRRRAAVLDVMEQAIRRWGLNAASEMFSTAAEMAS